MGCIEILYLLAGQRFGQIKACYETVHLSMIRGLKDAVKQLKSDQTKALEEFKRKIDSIGDLKTDLEQYDEEGNRLVKVKFSIKFTQKFFCYKVLDGVENVRGRK